MVPFKFLLRNDHSETRNTKDRNMSRLIVYRYLSIARSPVAIRSQIPYGDFECVLYSGDKTSSEKVVLARFSRSNVPDNSPFRAAW